MGCAKRPSRTGQAHRWPIQTADAQDFIIAFLLFSRSPRPEDNQTAALKAQLPATYLFGASAYAHSFDEFRANLSSLQTIKSDVRRPPLGHPTGRSIGEQSAAGAAPMKATLFMAQNTNNDHLVRAACLNRKKEPASERDSDGPVDQRKNDGVDHASLHCFLRTRGITLPVQAFRFHRGRPDRRHAQSSRSPGRRRRPGHRRQKDPMIEAQGE
jgi:hypothetical protein